MQTPAERYENLIKRLGGTNQDLGEMQSIADAILQVGFNSAVEYLKMILNEPKLADKLAEAPRFSKL